MYEKNNISFKKHIYLKTGVKTPFLVIGKYNRNFLKLILPSPLDVSLKVTERCNSRCITCNIWQEQADKPELSIGELEEIFRQLAEIHIKTVGLYGGEPLLRNDIGKVAQKAKKIVKGAKVMIITNGLLLKNKAQELLDAGVDFVFISLDGIGEVNDQIRGIPGGYQKVVEGIKELKKIDVKKKIKVNIGTTLLPLNIRQIPQLIELARELDISWSFNLFDIGPYHFRNVNNNVDLRKIDENLIDEGIEYMREARKKYPKTLLSADSVGLKFAKEYLKGEKPFLHCVLGYLRIYIDSYKNVYSGCWAMPPIGNIKENKLKDIIRSPRYKKRLLDMYELKCPYCTCGFLINCLINNPLSGIKFFFRNIPFWKI